ncbi:ankyrin repeat-containing domain protein [Ephemerocybe angulata]|uniref:Ankyrin repeat-containing domain protein n=1 Tax=Ephemerocybe angulata TaxID=980116 RepID=A0A8H6HNB1_9AGAR|nr:ankyrin repeat-containing domain protein [Tulosesus angulatus]
MLALGCNFEKARKVWLLLAHTDTNPNIPNSYGLTPLSKVRQNIDLLCFRYLLSNPLLKVDFVDGESSPSIWRGSSRDYTDDDLIHLLMLDPDFDLNRPGATGSNALHVAIQSDCSASTVAALLAAAEGSVDINMKNRQERTPLMLAMTSRIEREQKIGVLLSQPDLDPNIREEIEDHGAVLHKAVKSGDPAICRLLLSHSLTDVNLKDSKKNTPLMPALNNCYSSKSAQYTEIVQMLCAHETIDINAPLLHAFSSPTSTFACGLLLAQEGIDVNARSVYFGRTALMMSIDLPAESAEAKVRMLLSVPRVDVNLCDCYKEPPLSKAIKNGSGAVCRLLLSHPSIDVNLRDSQGFTPLMHACRGAHQESNLEVIWLLLSRPGLEPSFLWTEMMWIYALMR